ncbi:MAG TPA: sugar ABC transporter substrate-binding protein, partial [Limnochordia bacterium]|nr:sugar ABC transporter substrate-binding protein [Limnochordia bacterium]
MGEQTTRWLTAALASSLTIGLAAGVSSAKSLEFWTIGLSAGAVDWLNSTAFPEFTKAHGVDVHLTNLSWDDYWDKITTAGAGGVGPDVLVTDGDMGVSWGRSGFMLPLNHYVDAWKDSDSLVPGMFAPDDQNGNIYALPYWLDIRGTVYNKQLFSQAGLDPNTPPQGWTQMENYVKKLTRIQDGVLKQIGLFESWQASDWGQEETYGAYAMQRHTPLFFNQDDTKVMFNQPANVETVEFLARLYKIVNPAVAKNEVQDPFNGFYDGKVAMTSGGTWVPSTAYSQDPSWKQNLGFFVGRYSPETQPAALTYVNGIGISKFSKDPDLAWSFIQWLMSPDISPTLNAKSGTVSAVRT